MGVCISISVVYRPRIPEIASLTAGKGSLKWSAQWRTMPDPLRIDAGECTADEIITAIRDGRRVVVTTTILDAEHEVTLRYDGLVFYCDTPTRLHRHESEREMRACIRKMGYGAVGDA